MFVGRSRAEDVARALLGRILAQDFTEGNRLPPEQHLAQMFGVSRLTAREAVKIVAAKGVLEVRQGSGTRVRPINDWSPLDPDILFARARHEESAAVALAKAFLEARRTIEVGIVRLAAPRMDEARLEALAQNVDMMRKSCRGTPDVAAFVDADIAFHDGIMQAAHNPFLGAMFDPFIEILHLTRTQTSAHEPIRRHAITDHRRILDALSCGDPEGAAAAMDRHIRHVERDVDTYVGGPLALLLTAQISGQAESPLRRGRP